MRFYSTQKQLKIVGVDLLNFVWVGAYPPRCILSKRLFVGKTLERLSTGQLVALGTVRDSLLRQYRPNRSFNTLRAHLGAIIQFLNSSGPLAACDSNRSTDRRSPRLSNTNRTAGGSLRAGISVCMRRRPFPACMQRYGNGDRIIRLHS